METVALVSLLVLLQYFFFGMAVGWARGKYGVQAPAITGHDVFERYFRVQQNTLELLVVMLPALWLFAYYVSAPWAAGLGVVYLVGRTLYFLGYVRDPSKREVGFGITALPILALLGGAVVGVLGRLVGA